MILIRNNTGNNLPITAATLRAGNAARVSFVTFDFCPNAEHAASNFASGKITSTKQRVNFLAVFPYTKHLFKNLALTSIPCPILT